MRRTSGLKKYGPDLPCEAVKIWHDGNRLFIKGVDGNTYRLSEDETKWLRIDEVMI